MSQAPSPSVTELVEQFRLKERARDRGRDNQPPHDSPRLDIPETEVVEHCRDLFTDRLTEWNGHRASFEERTRRLETAGAEEANCDSRVEQACLDMKEAVDEEETDLEQLARNAQQAIGDMHAFRREEGLEGRASDYPDNRWLLGGVLASLVLLETLVNGLFFGANVEGGMIAGTSYAVLVSVLNVVALGLLGSHALRKTRHREPLQKMTGWTVLGLVAAVALSFNLLVAHYREALAIDYPPEPAAGVTDSALADGGVEVCWRGPDETDADQEALCLFARHPFRLGGFYSYLLLLIGVSFWLLGVADWFKLDDPYPGYGQRDRRRRRAEGELSDRRAEVLESLKGIHDGAVDDLARGFTDPLDSWRLALDDFGRLERMNRDLAEFAVSLEASVRGALDIYRNVNVEYRTTPEPSAWRSPWAAEWDVPEAPATEQNVTRRKPEVEKMSSRLRAALQDRRSKLEACWETQNERVKGIARLDHFERAGPR